MMMTDSQEYKVAIVQFGNLEDKDVMAIAKEMSKEVDWYIFEDGADYRFEVKALYEHYDMILECINKDNFEEIK